jgi:hypothetical protein
VIVTSFPKRRFGAVLLLAAGIGVAACGGDDDAAVAADPTDTTATTAAPAATASTAPAPTTFEACADLYVDATNQLDLTGIDTSDGLTMAEAQLADDRLAELEVTYPVIADDHACAAMLQSASVEQVQAFAARLNPAVLVILQTTPEETVG